MMDSGLLLVATMAVPLAMVVACLHPAFYERILTWLPLAAVPGLLAALLERGDSIVIAPAPLRLTLALDEVGAMLLGGASLLWGAAGFYASISMRGRPGVGRFAIWWLLTLTGSLGVFIVADMTSFYLVFSLASLAAYGLVSFEGTARAQHAGLVYMVLALVGEALILLGFVMLVTATPGGNPLIRDAVAMLPGSPLESPAVLLLILGFGLKMGLVPLHVWMPLAHPVAPIPASAVLSGVIVKAGVIGLIRFLPLEVPSPDWGMALVGLGLLTAFYGVLVGLTQPHAKTILAYSTVSQMGVVAAIHWRWNDDRGAGYGRTRGVLCAASSFGERRPVLGRRHCRGDRQAPPSIVRDHSDGTLGAEPCRASLHQRRLGQIRNQAAVWRWCFRASCQPVGRR